MLPVRRATRQENSNRSLLFPALEQQFDQFWNEFFGDSNLTRVKSNSGYPKMNVSLEGDQWKIRLAVPGVKKEDLKVETHPGFVRISGQMSEDYRSEENTEYYVRELAQSRFSREVSLPEQTTGEPNASLREGILTLSWKTNVPQNKPPKTIQIE